MSTIPGISASPPGATDGLPLAVPTPGCQANKEHPAVTVREAKVRNVVVLSLGEHPSGGCDGGCCGAAGPAPRVPVLACADALTAEGARVELVTACSDAELDDAVKPLIAGEADLVVAADS